MTFLQDATENPVRFYRQWKILTEQKKQNELPLAKSTSFLHAPIAVMDANLPFSSMYYIDSWIKREMEGGQH